MRIKVRKFGVRRRALHRWHKWFAWRPVRVPNKGNEMAWLETVRRKGKYYSNYSDNGWNWEYENL